MRHRTARIAAVIATSVLLTGCGGADTEPSSTSTSEAPPTTTEDAGVPGGESATGTRRSYVALGDSFTAAPMVPPSDLTDGCLRSGGNYPHLVATELDLALVDVSCVGAQTASLTTAQPTTTGDAPAQLEALDADVDLVTLGIGANDGNLFGTLVMTCSMLQASNPTGSPCLDQQADLPKEATPAAILTQIEEDLGSAVDSIRERAPQAAVLLVGYPQLVPAAGTCEALPLADGDYRFAREINTRINDTVRSAAEAAGATYVDVETPSQGHDICAAEPWVNGATTDPDRALAFHPFAEGQAAAARAVLIAAEEALASRVGQD